MKRCTVEHVTFTR